MPDRPLRPLMVVPDFDRVGGYELQALSLAAFHRRRGVPALLVSNQASPRPDHEVRCGVPIHRLPASPPSRPNWAALFVSFLRFLRHHRHEYDVVHCHALTYLAACCARIGRLLGKPVLVKVATERDVREFHDRRSLASRLFFRWLRRSDRLLCLSESIRQEAIACGFSPQQAVRLPNGVDVERFAPATAAVRAAARAALGLDAATVALLFVGRLVLRKGVDVLLAALARATGRDRCRLLLVGDGDQRLALTAQAVALGLTDRVQFLGERREVDDCYAAADMFVFPSRLEGLPNALLEAMACGLPAIATTIGGCLDVVAKGTGRLVPPDDIEALAVALDQLIQDPAAREALGAAGRRHIEQQFSFAVTTERLQAIYRELVAPPR